MFKTQFTAWAQGTYPFSIGLGPGQSPLDYWRTYKGTADGGVLAVSHFIAFVGAQMGET